MLRPKRGQQGFTLLEMVVVLAIIGTLAAMAMPSITASVWQQRQASAAQDLARFLRGIRDLTRRSGVAHNAVFRARDSEDLGLIEVWMGMNNKCRLTDWLYARSAPVTANHRPVMRFDMLTYNPFTSTERLRPGGDHDVLAMRVRTVAFNNAAGQRTIAPVESANLVSGELCFEPAGDVYFRAPAAVADTPAQIMDFQSQLVQFAVTRLERGSTSTAIGVDRHVILPPGGVARVRQ